MGDYTHFAFGVFAEFAQVTAGEVLDRRVRVQMA